MHGILRLAVAAIGLLNLAIGLAFLVQPAAMAALFFVAPVGSQGLATIRADFPGFFLAAGGFALWGAWARQGWPLLVPVVLLAIAFAGRSISLVVDGRGPNALPPMIAEALMIAVLLAARRSFAATGRHRG